MDLSLTRQNKPRKAEREVVPPAGFESPTTTLRFRGVHYDEIARRTASLVETPQLPKDGRPYFALDATGVGRPALDLLRAARMRAHLLPILIHGGQAVTWPTPETVHERPEIGVPKRDLCSAVQVVLRTGRLKLGSGVPLAETLAAELCNFRVRISLSGTQTFGAGPFVEWREGAHDDLVLAVACAAYIAEKGLMDVSLARPLAEDLRLFPLTTDAVWRIVRRTAKRAGVTSPIRPHSFRRAAIQSALDHGASLRGAQDFAGHASPTTTARYDRERNRAHECAGLLVSY
jgi:hypothetical protein